MRACCSASCAVLRSRSLSSIACSSPMRTLSSATVAVSLAMVSSGALRLGGTTRLDQCSARLSMIFCATPVDRGSHSAGLRTRDRSMPSSNIGSDVSACGLASAVKAS